MLLLETMTGATAETRLVLFAWISVFDMKPIPDDRGWIASILHVTRKQLKTAIDYLVEENYLLKKRNLSRADTSEKKAAEYLYTLRVECWRLWPVVLHSTKFADIFKHVIEGNVRHGSTASRKLKPLNSSGRLTLAILVAHANSALNVVGFDHSSNSKLLGISASNLNKIIRSLVSNGYLTAYSHANTAKVELRSLGVIYRIDAVTPNRKRINIGLPPIEGVESIALVTKLMRYYHKAAKWRKSDIYPSQSSRLLDEHYFKLSKIFHDNGLFTFMHQVCQSIIFSTASDCLSGLMTKSKSERKDALQQQSDELEESIKVKLSNIILNGKFLSLWQDIDELENKNPNSLKELERLKNFTIKQLSMELTYSVISLVRQLILFLDVYQVPFCVIGHQSNTVISVLTGVDSSPVREVQNKSESTLPALCQYVTSNNAKARSYAPLVLTLMVPNLQHINDCVVINDELFVEQSTLKDPRIQVVDKVTVILPKTAKR